MMKTMYFDMDGTLANFYGVENWLEYLEKEDIRPYKVAKPLFNFSVFARYLHKLQKAGYKIGIISWLSKCGTDEYNKKVIQTKEKWLKEHLSSVEWDEIHIVKYGTPKSNFGIGILWDDEERNRKDWEDKGGIAYDVNDILKTIKNIIG